jgi:3-hydroxyisobutyrate dehydrogenase
MHVGFVGLGRMGAGMALNLQRGCGAARVSVFDRVEGAMAPLVEAGASRAASLGGLASEADLLFLSLPGPPEVEDAVFGAGGVIESAKPGLLLVDLSTNALATVRRVHEAMADRNGAFLDAPVSGGPAGAASRDLVIWAGGSKDDYARALPALSAIAKNPRHVGAAGAGTVTKLGHNLMGYLVLMAMAEGFSIGVKAGMDPLDLWEAWKLGVVGKTTPLDMLVKQFLPGKYEPPAFALKLAHKDVTLATGLARELGVPLRFGNMVREEMTEALARGFGDQDSRAYLKLQLERAGVAIAVEPGRIDQAVAAAAAALKG